MTQPYMINTRRRISPWVFFGLTYGLSWLLWILAALSGQDVTRPPWNIAYVLGAATPTIIGIILTYVSEDRDGRRDFWRRTFDPRRIRWSAYVFIVLVFPLVYGTAILIDRLTGGSSAEFAALQPVNLLALAGMPIMMLLNGFIEELGWRGFVLDRLQLRWSALRAGVFLGLIHALWHIPLFLTQGTLQYEWGLFSRYYWMFILNATLGSVIHTWLYNRNCRSILSAILLHAAHNLTLGLIMPISSMLLIYVVVLNAIIVLRLVRIDGAKTLTRQERVKCRAHFRGEID